jgi:hypothetical protein
MSRWILAVVSALALVLLSRPVPVSTQAIQRSMAVSVVDQSGAPVPNLGPPDFIVREDNASREVLGVAPDDQPMQIAVLVDNSRAAREEIADIRRALPAFFDVLTQPTASGKHHEIAVLTLSERPTILADYTFDRARLEKAIGLVWEREPGMYLLDAAMEVAGGFKKREATRPVIIAITSDGPELSSRHYSQVLDPLRETGTTLHVISLGSPSRDITSSEAVNRNIVVEEGPRASGGIHERLLASSALPAKLKQLADVLTHQYRVTYAHPDTLIPPEHITVSARRADLTAHGTLIKDPQARR